MAELFTILAFWFTDIVAIVNRVIVSAAVGATSAFRILVLVLTEAIGKRGIRCVC